MEKHNQILWDFCCPHYEIHEAFQHHLKTTGANLLKTAINDLSPCKQDVFHVWCQQSQILIVHSLEQLL